MKKVIRTINSCTTFEQLQSARMYDELFMYHTELSLSECIYISEQIANKLATFK